MFLVEHSGRHGHGVPQKEARQTEGHRLKQHSGEPSTDDHTRGQNPNFRFLSPELCCFESPDYGTLPSRKSIQVT